MDNSHYDIQLFSRIDAHLEYADTIANTNIEHIASASELQLYAYRNRINEYDTDTTNNNWEYYKKLVNPYEFVYTHKKYANFPDSISSIKPLSRSYFKMIEMLDVTQFFNTISNTCYTAHVCEGPGGFIEAIYNVARENHKSIHKSIAITLKSTRTNIPGWKRATQFLKANRGIIIAYGKDGTGDITVPDNQQHFIDNCNYITNNNKMDIFTSDGGFDFSSDYMNQERLIFPLLLSSTILGFHTLKLGGTFILKIFDFYNKATTDLLYILASHFKEWTLYKPSMSRPCNPEQYFIGKGFVGYSDSLNSAMQVWSNMINEKSEIYSIVTSEYTNDFKTQLVSLQLNSFYIQQEYLERVFNIIAKNDETLIRSYLHKTMKASYEWCVRFNVPIRYISDDIVNSLQQIL